MSKVVGRTMRGSPVVALLSALAFLIATGTAEAQNTKPQPTAPKTAPQAPPKSAEKPEKKGEEDAEVEEEPTEQKAADNKKVAAQKDAAALAAKKAKASQLADAGLKSLIAGKNDEAAKSLSLALDTGALPPADVARALYRRGIAHRKLGRASLAIADFSQALFLTGLSEAEKLDARHQRGLAYQTAGMNERAAEDLKAGKPLELTAAATAPSAPQPTAPQLTPRETRAAGLEPKARPPKPVEAAKMPEPSTTSSNPSSVSSFFSNLFSSTPTEPAKKPAPTQTSWQQSTQVRSTVAEPTTVPVVKTAAKSTPPASTTPVTTAALPEQARVQLQVASLKSEGQASELIRQIKASHRDLLNGREVRTEKSVIGTMGTFYLVRIGPFASEQDGLTHCGRLRQSGLDCLVVK